MTKATKKWMLALLALTAIPPIAACGGLAEENTSPDSLAVLHGTAYSRLGTQLAGAPVYLTILWFPTSYRGAGSPDETGTMLIPMPGYAQQSVAYTASFPFDFEIGISSVPPAESRYDLSQDGFSGSIAWGNVVAFRDLNGNGVLDRGAPGVAGDEIIGTSDRGVCADFPGSSSQSLFYVVYFEGTPPPGESTSIPQGFSILTYSTSPPFDGYLPIDSHVELDLSAFSACEQVYAMRLGCSTVSYKVEPWPMDDSMAPPAGAEINCDPDYASLTAPPCYTWYQGGTYGETSLGACTKELHAGLYCLPEGSTPPADWPCN